jgi:aminoglycoside phosphotransferase (APT) family kinase protein
MMVIDADLVRRLVASQFPQWAGLPVAPLEFGGWDNRTFHLGADMSVRLPRAAPYAAQVEKEHRWLPALAPHLSLPIPAPLAMGAPGQGYPWPWSIYRWIEGETARRERIADLNRFAIDLAEFLAALQRIDAADGPTAGKHNFHRGGPLATYDAETRRSIAALGKQIDPEAATAVWEAALATTWRGAPVWVHGDMAPGNLLVTDGRLNAVIDFGCSGVGDPACDLAIAWTFFSGESREAFRTALPLDAGAWARGRGWTLWKAVIVWAASVDSNPRQAEKSERIVDDLLADHRLAA